MRRVKVIKSKPLEKQRRYRAGKPLEFDSKGRPVFGYNRGGKPVCYASLPSGKRCMEDQRCENGRCKNHGGMSVSGPKHPKSRLNKYMDSLPEDLGQQLVDYANDS